MLRITTFHCLLWGGLGGGVLGKVLWRAELLFRMGGRDLEPQRSSAWTNEKG